MSKPLSKNRRNPIASLTSPNTGSTVCLRNGGDLDTAARIAGHESTRTTRLNDRTGDRLTLNEIERVRI